MKRFRVLSDLHLDINSSNPIKFDDDTFTVICGDLGGETKLAIDWLRENVKHGVFVSGNHLVYNDFGKTIADLRKWLSAEFPLDDDVTYLDVENGVFSKVVDGIMFVGTCMYTNFKLSFYDDPKWETVEYHKRHSHKVMNDFKWGIAKEARDEISSPTYITPDDYEMWFNNAFRAIDDALSKNEASDNPLPVVLITHYPLIADMIKNSGYVEQDNFSSYGSDMQSWIEAHPSIKCYCCGHAHDVSEKYRRYSITRPDGSKCLLVNNARGYVYRNHDQHFNPNVFVNAETWEFEVEPESEDEIARKKAAAERYMRHLAWFM